MDSANSLSVTCRNAIVCDDVRREDSGKAILIGVYTGDIVVAGYPSIFSAKFWFEVSSEGNGSAPFSARAILEPGGIELFSMNAEIERKRGPLGDEGTEDYFAASSRPFRIEQSGCILFQFRSGDGDWETIRSKRVVSAAELRDPPVDNGS